MDFSKTDHLTDRQTCKLVSVFTISVSFTSEKLAVTNKTQKVYFPPEYVINKGNKHWKKFHKFCLLGFVFSFTLFFVILEQLWVAQG